MSVLRIFLFGRFRVLCGQQPLAGLDARKVQELLCYLLMYRDRTHAREPLAGLLWGDTTTAQSKRYLRKALWQLQAALSSQSECINDRLLRVEPDWVRANPEADFWLDVAVFEQAFTQVQGMPGKELDARRARALRSAVDLYRADLLQGCYEDWCLYERERFLNMYLAMLDKLMGYCEAHHDYEGALVHGTRILRYDRARERTHRRLMRLRYLAGDRTAALRQYERCVTALDEELGVRPAKRTVALYEQIGADQLDGPTSAPAETGTAGEMVSAPRAEVEVLDDLKRLRVVLAHAQYEVEQTIQAVELDLNSHP